MNSVCPRSTSWHENTHTTSFSSLQSWSSLISLWLRVWHAYMQKWLVVSLKQKVPNEVELKEVIKPIRNLVSRSNSFHEASIRHHFLFLNLVEATSSHKRPVCTHIRLVISYKWHTHSRSSPTSLSFRTRQIQENDSSFYTNDSISIFLLRYGLKPCTSTSWAWNVYTSCSTQERVQP